MEGEAQEGIPPPSVVRAWLQLYHPILFEWPIALKGKHQSRQHLLGLGILHFATNRELPWSLGLCPGALTIPFNLMAQVCLWRMLVPGERELFADSLGANFLHASLKLHFHM
jgi:hypothetical protein